MLRLLDSQKALWPAAALVTAAVLRPAYSELGAWVVLAALPVAGASWLVLRALVEVVIRRAFPAWIREHLPALLSGANEASDRSVWEEPVSLRIAGAEFRRLWGPTTTAVVADFRRARALAQRSEDDLVEVLRSMAARWLPEDVIQSSMTTEGIQFVDPVHASIAFGADLRLLIGHPLIQRLNEIRQLAFAFPSFPGGTHTRLAHSLGVAFLAASVTRRALEGQLVFSDDGTHHASVSGDERKRLVNLATVCGLVHDLGHPPLGHTLDRFFGARFKPGSEIADKEFLPRTLERLQGEIESVDGVLLADVLRILAEDRENLDGWELFIAALIDSELDVDRLDYLIRDAHYTGQHEGQLNVRRLLDGVRPFRREGAVYLSFDVAALSDIEQFIYAREVMYLRCYERHEKVVSEWLVLRAMEHLFQDHPTLEDEIDHFRLLSDTQLVELVRRSDSRSARELIERVYRSDALNYEEVYSVSFEAASLEDRLLGLHNDFAKRERTLLTKVSNFAAEIADAAAVHAHDVLVVLPDHRLSDERKQGLDIWLLRGEGDGFEISRLLAEESDRTVSDLLRRRKYVPLEDVLAATSLEVLQETASRRGVSLLRLLRRPRFRLRLFLHRRASEGRPAAIQALKGLGVRDGASELV
jgi:hypothetical protein